LTASNAVAPKRTVSVRRNLVANYVGRGWSAIMGLAFIPIYTKLMGVEAMGVIGLFVTLQALCMLLDAGLSTTLNREMARMSEQEGTAQDMRDLLRTFEIPFWIAAFIGGAIVASLAPFIAHRWVQVHTLSPAAVETAIRLMGAVLFFQLPLSLYGGGLLGIQRQVEYSVLSATWYTLRFGGAVLALHLFGPVLSTFFVWQVFVSAVATGLSALLLWRTLPLAARGARFERGLLASRWKFAAGLGGISITLLILNNVDKVILSRFVSLGAFGYYTLAWTLANAIRLLADPVFITFFPRLSQVWASSDMVALGAIYHRISRFMTLAVVPFGLTIAFFAPEAMFVWTRSAEMTANTSSLLRLLAIGNVCLALTIVPYALQLASGWTSLALWSNLVAAIVLAPLMVLLVGTYGTLGGGIAWVALNATYLIVTVAIMHRRLLPGHALRWAFEDIGISTLATLAVLALVRIVLPVPSAPLAALMVIAVSFLLAQACAVAASPLRSEIFRRFRSQKEVSI